MKSKVVGGVGILLVVGAGVMYFKSGSNHDYEVRIQRTTGGLYSAQKSPSDPFEVDYGYLTRWLFINETGRDIDLQFDERLLGQCDVTFQPHGIFDCQTPVIQLAAGGREVVTAEVHSSVPVGSMTVPSDLKVGDRGSINLQKIDPDLEIERESTFREFLPLGMLVLGSVMVLGSLRMRRAAL